MNRSYRINPLTDALLVIDPQNDFCEGGALAVPEGHGIEDGILELASQFSQIVLTQDWHPENHTSFASQHPGKAPFSTILLDYGPQTLWPDHCVQGSHGAEFTDNIQKGLMNQVSLILRKGNDSAVDSYSAFYENDQITATGLSGWLRERCIQRVFLVGLAYDFCVGYSALDAKERAGHDVVIIKDLCRSIRQPLKGEYPDTVVEMESRFKDAGVVVATMEEILPQSHEQPQP